MTTTEFKKVARSLKVAYEELNKEALVSSVSIFSPQYKEARDLVRAAVLKENGFTIEEYDIVRNQLEAERLAKKDTPSDVSQILEKVATLKGDKGDDGANPSKEELVALFKEILPEVIPQFIPKPSIINKIVKETTIEKPTIVKETRVETINSKYDDTLVRSELDYLNDKVDSLGKLSREKDEAVRNELKQFFHDYFSENFKHNIDIMGMPDFRKLAMGLRQDIDALRSTSTSSSGTGVTLETPSGTPNGVLTTFTVLNTPKFICVDGLNKFETLHYTYLAGTITITDGVPPNGYIISFY